MRQIPVARDNAIVEQALYAVGEVTFAFAELSETFLIYFLTACYAVSETHITFGKCAVFIEYVLGEPYYRLVVLLLTGVVPCDENKLKHKHEISRIDDEDTFLECL